MQVQRELMILGLISFVLFLTETSGGAVKLGESWLVPFEFAHFLIFFVAIAYTLQAFWLAVMVSEINAQHIVEQAIQPREAGTLLRRTNRTKQADKA